MTINLKDGNVFTCISDSDLAELADWANKQKFTSFDSEWRRPFALIREGADTLLRARARNSNTKKENV